MNDALARAVSRGGLPFPAFVGSAAVLGVLWGVTCAWGDTVDSKFIQSATNLAGPWLVLAFLVGLYGRSSRDGAVGGLLALTTSVVAYYVTQRLGLRAANTRGLLAGMLWLPISAAAGAVFGTLGYAFRGTNSRYRAGAAVALGGALVAESGILLLNQGGFVPGAVLYLAFEMSAGWAMLVLWLGREHGRRKLEWS
jgi:Family of unknown function (DUF6518)